MLYVFQTAAAPSGNWCIVLFRRMSFNSTFNNDQSIISCPPFFFALHTETCVEDTALHFCEGRFNICYIAVCYFTRIKICVFVLRKCNLPSPCWIAGTRAPHSERRTWSGSTSTGSHSHLRTWSCGRCHRSARRPGEQPSLPLPWPVGSQSLCSWITAAGYLCKKKSNRSMKTSAFLKGGHVISYHLRIHFEN